jgi:hypothetical protein
MTLLLDRLREISHTATITMMARRPHPPATPPAIGPARELLMTGVNAGGVEAVAEDGTGCKVGVGDDCAVVEDVGACEVLLVLSTVELAGNSIDSCQIPLLFKYFTRTNL